MKPNISRRAFLKYAFSGAGLTIAVGLTPLGWRLAKAAEEEPVQQTDESDRELAQATGPEEGTEEANDADTNEDGDLATRWKNLRKARRGVHASNE